MPTCIEGISTVLDCAKGGGLPVRLKKDALGQILAERECVLGLGGHTSGAGTPPLRECDGLALSYCRFYVRNEGAGASKFNAMSHADAPKSLGFLPNVEPETLTLIPNPVPKASPAARCIVRS